MRRGTAEHVSLRVNFFIARSRARVGWWEFSARLFRYLDWRCSTERSTRRRAATVAVGTALAGGPPHRSQRAGLPHWAPALGSGGKAHFREGMHHAGGW